jgi:hypothetical protein
MARGIVATAFTVWVFLGMFHIKYTEAIEFHHLEL